MVHVRNASLAHILADRALESGVAAGKNYFITNDEPVLLWDWINRLLQRLQLPIVTAALPAAVAYPLGAVLESLHRLCALRSEPRLTRFLARQLSTHHTYDITRAKRDLGYAPRISMREGEDELVHEFLKKQAGRPASG